VLFRNGLFLFRQSAAPLTADTWRVLHRLPKLQVLCVNIISHASVFGSNGVDVGNSETAVLKPLVELRGLRCFELVIRWKCPYKASERQCRLQGDYSEAPFRLTEIVDHVIRNRVITGSEEMIDVRAWATSVIGLVKMDDDRWLKAGSRS
jgi:hypothetical protein